MNYPEQVSQILDNKSLLMSRKGKKYRDYNPQDFIHYKVIHFTDEIIEIYPSMPPEVAKFIHGLEVRIFELRHEDPIPDDYQEAWAVLVNAKSTLFKAYADDAHRKAFHEQTCNNLWGIFADRNFTPPSY